MKRVLFSLLLVLAVVTVQAQIDFSAGADRASSKPVLKLENDILHFVHPDGTSLEVLKIDGDHAVLQSGAEAGTTVLWVKDGALLESASADASQAVLKIDGSNIIDPNLPDGPATIGTMSDGEVAIDFGASGGSAGSLFYNGAPSKDNVLLATYLLYYNDFQSN